MSSYSQKRIIFTVFMERKPIEKCGSTTEIECTIKRCYCNAYPKPTHIGVPRAKIDGLD